MSPQWRISVTAVVRECHRGGVCYDQVFNVTQKRSSPPEGPGRFFSSPIAVVDKHIREIKVVFFLWKVTFVTENKVSLLQAK